MQEIIKDLPVLVMTLALILFLCWVRKSTLTEVAAGAHKIGTKTGTLGRCRIFTWDEVVSKKEFFERVTFYGKKGKPEETQKSNDHKESDQRLSWKTCL